MQLEEATQILSDNGYIVENKHFDLWQYKLKVKKLLKPIQTKYHFKDFEAMRSYIYWELGGDIVKDVMTFNFEKNVPAETTVETIKDMVIEALKIGG